MDSGIIIMQLSFQKKTLLKRVKFEYNLNHDTPEKVTNEMLQELSFPQEMYSCISNKIYRLQAQSRLYLDQIQQEGFSKYEVPDYLTSGPPTKFLNETPNRS